MVNAVKNIKSLVVISMTGNVGQLTRVQIQKEICRQALYSSLLEKRLLDYRRMGGCLQQLFYM